MKRITAIITAILIISGMVTITSAHARSARKHTLEGVMIGAGVTLLGAAILSEVNRNSTIVSYNYTHRRPLHSGNRPHKYDRDERHGRHDSYDRHRSHHKAKHDRRYARGPRGHWEKEKIWVGPVYEKRWNPGHYNKRGAWVSGRYKKFVIRKGHWKQKKVWVRH